MFFAQDQRDGLIHPDACRHFASSRNTLYPSGTLDLQDVFKRRGVQGTLAGSVPGATSRSFSQTRIFLLLRA